MKKFFFLALAVTICTTTQAQNFLGMKIKKYGISASNDQDRVTGLDAQYFNNLSKTEFSPAFMEGDFPKEAISSMTCENPTFRAEVTVMPSLKSTNLQLNLGTSLMLNRVDATEYSFWGSGYDSNVNNIEFNSYSNEAALDASLVYHQKLLFLHFYGGLGTNLGYTFAGNMQVTGTYANEDEVVYDGSDGGSYSTTEYVSFSENHQMKNSLHQRAFLQGGVSVIFFKRLEFGLEARRGIGYRYNAGNPAKFTNLIAGGLNLRWNLK